MNAEFWKLLLKQAVALLLPSLGGFKLWLINKVLDFGGSAIHDILTEWKLKTERAKAQKEAEVKKDEVINNPQHTADEAGKAYEEMYNAGRKPNP
jgi:hypothetical protein